ncbi:MAG: VanZ family protein [Gallionellaceae bacterium]
MNGIFYALIESSRFGSMKTRFWYAILACYLLVLGFLSLNPWIRPVSTNEISSPDKLSHAFAYGGLTIIIFLCFAQSRHGNFRNSARTWIAAISIAVLFGVAIELAQSLFTVNRAGSLEDAIANAIGAGLGYVAYNMVKYLYDKRRQKFERSLKP